MPPVPDLVLLSKLDTEFCSSPEYTQHIYIVSGSRSERRMVRKKERWQKEKALGQGSFGVVWLERCIHGDNEGQMRAVKKIHKLERNNYYRELEAIALFSHPKYEQCFVKSLGWYDDIDSIYISMEYLSNGDLRKYLGSPLAEHEGQSIISQVLEGLDYMHQNGFTHRDLKPANILVVTESPEWWVKIADFGISKRTRTESTSLRTFTGTRAFMAPELFGISPRYTNSVDIWSLGVIAYLILTGETLFQNPDRLGEYVDGILAFPSDVLLENNVSLDGCDFIKSLMAPFSKDRPGAKESRQSPWLAYTTEHVDPETQRKKDVPRLQNSQSSFSGIEASASWSTKDYNFFGTRNTTLPMNQQLNLVVEATVRRDNEEQSTASPLNSSKEMLTARVDEKPSITLRLPKQASSRSNLSKSTTNDISSGDTALDALDFNTHKSLDTELRSYGNTGEPMMDNQSSAAEYIPSKQVDTQSVNDVQTFERSRHEHNVEKRPIESMALSDSGNTQSSFRTENSTYSPSNLSLLENVEDAIRRLIQPELTALKKEQAERRDHHHEPPGLTTPGSGEAREFREKTPFARKLIDNGEAVLKPKGSAYEVKRKPSLPVQLSTQIHVLEDQSATSQSKASFNSTDKSLSSKLKSKEEERWLAELIEEPMSQASIKTQKLPCTTFEGHSTIVTDVKFSPDGTLIASGSLDNTARLWNLTTGLIHKILKSDTRVTKVEFSPNGKLIASGSYHNRVMVWDSATGILCVEFIEQLDYSPTVVSFSPDNTLIATKLAEGGVLLSDPVTRVTRAQLLLQKRNIVRDLTFSPNGKLIASTSERTITVWELATFSICAELQSENIQASFVNATFSPNSKMIMAAGQHTVTLWDTVTWDTRGSFDLDTRIAPRVAFSHDDKFIAYSQNVVLWLREASTFKSYSELRGHTDVILAIVFSPNNRLLASASRGHNIRLWNVDTKTAYCVLKGHSNGVLSIAFSPDSKLLVSGSYDNTVKLWDLEAYRQWQDSDDKMPEGYYTALVMYDSGQAEDYGLSFVEGQVLWVVPSDDGNWLKAKDPVTKKIGSIPRHYIKFQE